MQVDSLLQRLPSASQVTFGFHSDDMTQVATPGFEGQFPANRFAIHSTRFRIVKNAAFSRAHDSCACDYIHAVYAYNLVYFFVLMLYCPSVVALRSGAVQVAGPILSGLATAPRIGHGGLVMANGQLFRVRGRLCTQGVAMVIFVCPIAL